jgi:CRISPR-associated exonuclease Cas4
MDHRIGVGRIRGLVLHKLIEEVLTGELLESEPALRERAQQLLGQLAAAADRGPPPEAGEMARTALRTLSLPELATVRPGLVPESPVYGPLGDRPETLVTGRADAVAYRDGRPSTVVDWKSDASPSAAQRRIYSEQLRDYVLAMGAERGAVVYMSRGEIDWISP